MTVRSIFTTTANAAGTEDFQALDEIEKMIRVASAQDFPLVSRLGVDTSGEGWNGKTFEFTIETGPHAGGAAKPAGDNVFSLPTITTGLECQERPIRVLVPIEIDAFWEDLTVGGKVTKDGKSAIQRAVEDAMKAKQLIMHEGSLSDGTGVLGSISSVSSSSGDYLWLALETTSTTTDLPTRYDPKPAKRFFKPGMILKVWDSATEGNDNTGTAATAAQGLVVDEATSNTVLKCHTYVAGGSTTAFAAGDALVRHGAANSTDGWATQANVWGLRGIVSDTDPYVTRNDTRLYYGANAKSSNATTMKSRMVGDSTRTSMSREKLRQGLSEAQDSGGNISVIFWSREVDAEWNELHAKMARYDVGQASPKSVPGGIYTVRPAYFEGYNFDIVVDKDVTPYTAYGLTEKNWKFRMTPRGWHFAGQAPGQGGSMLHYLYGAAGTGTDTWAIVLRGAPQLICKLPCGNFQYKNIDYTVL